MPYLQMWCKEDSMELHIQIDSAIIATTEWVLWILLFSNALPIHIKEVNWSHHSLEAKLSWFLRDKQTILCGEISGISY